MMTEHFMPMRSLIRVYEVGADERVYEVTTSGAFGRYQVPAKQLSGPPLDIVVSEHRYRRIVAGYDSYTSRKHRVYRKRADDPVGMKEIRTGGAETRIFLKYQPEGALAYFIPRTGIVAKGVLS
jgi:hypothetical protein